jgi:RNA polymerase sigma factor (sigma-70 family)
VRPDPSADRDDLHALQAGDDTGYLHALQAGDDTGLDRLIARWEQPLFAFAWRYLRNTTDAHDLAVEVFVRLHQQRDRLRPDSNLRAWLFTTLANLCHNHHRWRQRHPALSLEAAAEADPGHGEPGIIDPADAAPTPAEALAQKEALASLGAAIDRLPHDLKTALLLHHFEHHSYREIAAITGCSERGVETRLYRARQLLEAAIQREQLGSGR